MTTVANPTPTLADAPPPRTGEGLGGEGKSFIEVQFPVSKLSKESYKERKAAAGQTLTGLGKWWGRKPLVLVRAIILGLLLPATDDPENDRETFLALMTMDDDGFLRRLKDAIPAKVACEHLPPSDRARGFAVENGKVSWKRGLPAEERKRLQVRALRAMSYDERLKYCERPEQIDGPSPEAWSRINAHLGTSSTSLPELIRELGQRRFGHAPRVGDAFCGGGSIPFEAARIGCDAYGSDLNPVAGLLTWGALNIVGGGQEAVNRAKSVQRNVFEEVQRQVDEWGIERNEEGWIADAYLYCNEVRDPFTGWVVPLAPSWVIAPKYNVIARLMPDLAKLRFDIEIAEGVSNGELRQADAEGTAVDGIRCPVDQGGRWLPPSQRHTTSVDQLRGAKGLRRWTFEDIVPRPDDVFQERLYCIRYMDPKTGDRDYCAPTQADRAREDRVLQLLRDRLSDWQERGFLPNRPIAPGEDINRPTVARGWTHWHHLFNPRQLLLNGLFAAVMHQQDGFGAKALLLMLGRAVNANSRLARWKVTVSGGIGGGIETFYAPALSTPFANYCCRALLTMEPAFRLELEDSKVSGCHEISLADAKSVRWDADIWITDPGYADVVRYEQLSEFFLAWYDTRLPALFPGWYSDSKRALAAAGKGEAFTVTLAECYTNLANHMPDDGFQVVMFTHQDPEVWADIGLTLWAARLQVSAAWTIQTETPTTGVKGGGNYVQGTVVLVLRKRKGDRRGDLSDLYPDIQAEVGRQIEQMLALDDKEEPNFGDADLQLAAYAAALRVLTGYAAIDEIDVQKELRRPRRRGEQSPLARLIAQAVRIASDYLVPAGLDRVHWRKLGAEERLYLKAIQTEAGGETREGVYQQLAQGLGAGPHRELYASRAANRVRFKTPTEMGRRDLGNPGDAGFPGSTLRQLLFAIHTVAAEPERDPRAARTYLRRELPTYWQDRLMVRNLARFLADTAEPLGHWRSDVAAARLLADSLDNDAM